MRRGSGVTGPRRILLALAIMGLTIMTEAKGEAPDQTPDPENTLLLALEAGTVTVRLRPDLAPDHVTRIKQLVREGFYDGLTFHRVLEGFMAQGGDPKGDGTGGSGTRLKAEFSSEKHVRGTVSMARSADPDSADSQFFIVYAETPHLDGQYTIWGEVVEGMDLIDGLRKGAPWTNGRVADPDRIVSMRIEADDADTD